MIFPTFPNEIAARIYAEKHKPLEAAMATPPDAEYRRRYGERAFNAMMKCRMAAASNDMRALHFASVQLSNVLVKDCPQLFDERRPRRMAA